MTTAEGTADAEDPLAFLDAQRECVLAIVHGLDEDLLTTPALPSGWTPLGLIGHPSGTPSGTGSRRWPWARPGTRGIWTPPANCSTAGPPGAPGDDALTAAWVLSQAGRVRGPV